MGKLVLMTIAMGFILSTASVASANHLSCFRDIDNDGKVDAADTKIIDDAMGAVVGKKPYDERVDFNEDGKINREDRILYRHCK